MMRLIVIVITATFAITGCDSDYDQMIKVMEKQIRDTIQVDWSRDGIPLDDLVTASKLCRLEHDLHGCEVVASQVTDIAISFSSCKADQHSKLCKIVVQAISKNPVLAILPESGALPLPKTPWYLSLPTKALESQGGKFGYRNETTYWWWQAWRTSIISCVALLVVFIGAWQCWRQWRRDTQQRVVTMARQDIARIDQEKSHHIQEKQAKADAEHQAKLAHEAAIADQQRVVMGNLAKQQEEQVAAKLAAEQAEIAKLLASVFITHGKPPRR